MKKYIAPLVLLGGIVASYFSGCGNINNSHGNEYKPIIERQNQRRALKVELGTLNTVPKARDDIFIGSTPEPEKNILEKMQNNISILQKNNDFYTSVPDSLHEISVDEMISFLIENGRRMPPAGLIYTYNLKDSNAVNIGTINMYDYRPNNQDYKDHLNLDSRLIVEDDRYIINVNIGSDSLQLSGDIWNNRTDQKDFLPYQDCKIIADKFFREFKAMLLRKNVDGRQSQLDKCLQIFNNWKGMYDRYGAMKDNLQAHVQNEFLSNFHIDSTAVLPENISSFYSSKLVREDFSNWFQAIDNAKTVKVDTSQKTINILRDGRDAASYLEKKFWSAMNATGNDSAVCFHKIQLLYDYVSSKGELVTSISKMGRPGSSIKKVSNKAHKVFVSDSLRTDFLSCFEIRFNYSTDMLSTKPEGLTFSSNIENSAYGLEYWVRYQAHFPLSGKKKIEFDNQIRFRPEEIIDAKIEPSIVQKPLEIVLDQKQQDIMVVNHLDAAIEIIRSDLYNSFLQFMNTEIKSGLIREDALVGIRKEQARKAKEQAQKDIEGKKRRKKVLDRFKKK